MSVRNIDTEVLAVAGTSFGVSSKGVIDREYPDSESKVSRESAEKFQGRYRGSVRLSSGYYRTDDEYDEHVRQVKALKLP